MLRSEGARCTAILVQETSADMLLQNTAQASKIRKDNLAVIFPNHLS